jgi:hypothetical protein
LTDDAQAYWEGGTDHRIFASTINDQESTINDQQSTINNQRSTINAARAVIEKQKIKLKRSN